MSFASIDWTAGRWRPPCDTARAERCAADPSLTAASSGSPAMVGALAGFLLALWHVAGVLLLVLLCAELGVEGWRRLSRLLRYRRPTRPDRVARADAYGGADWSV